MQDQIGQFVLELIAYGGGSAAVAFLIFRFLGGAWIESKFQQRLDQHRHLQAVELQRLRVEIDSMLSGAIKLQDKEFEILPDAWEQLDKAYSQIRFFTSPGREYPNVDQMNEEQLSEFLDRSVLLQTQRTEIREAHDKLAKYQELIYWHELHRARSAFGNLQDYVARNGIFPPQDLKSDFEKIAKILWSSIVDKEVGRGARDHKMENDGWRKLKADAAPLYKAIEQKIHDRLHSHASSASSNQPLQGTLDPSPTLLPQNGCRLKRH